MMQEDQLLFDPDQNGMKATYVQAHEELSSVFVQPQNSCLPQLPGWYY